MQKVIIIVFSVILVLVLALWGVKQIKGDTTEPQTEIQSEEQSQQPASEVQDTPVTQTQTPTETASVQETQAPAENDTPAEAPSENTEQPAEEPASQSSGIPEGVDAVLTAFNQATSKAASGASFTKIKKSELTGYTIEGDSLETLKKVGGAIYESLSEKTVKGTLNVGEETINGTKGSGDLIASTLTATDVKSATATASGDGLAFTIEINDSVNPGTQAIPLEKFSKDFLVLEEIQKYGADMDLTVISAEATVTNTIVKAETDANGNLTSLSLDYVYSGALTDCNYKFLGKTYTGLHGSGDLKVSVSYSGFAY